MFFHCILTHFMAYWIVQVMVVSAVLSSEKYGYLLVIFSYVCSVQPEKRKTICNPRWTTLVIFLRVSMKNEAE
jgi:hypothetical protein